MCKKGGWGPLGISLVTREEARSGLDSLKSQPSVFLPLFYTLLPTVIQKRNTVSCVHLIMKIKHYHMAGGS